MKRIHERAWELFTPFSLRSAEGGARGGCARVCAKAAFGAKECNVTESVTSIDHFVSDTFPCWQWVNTDVGADSCAGAMGVTGAD